MTRLQKILSVLLFVQIVIAAIIFWPSTEKTAEASPLLDSLVDAEVLSLSISDDRDNVAELSRSGETWVLSSGGDYPVQPGIVDALIAKLEAVEADRLVTRTSSSHERLKVAGDTFSRRIQVSLADGSKQTLFVGSAPNPRSVHVRRDGKDEVYLTGEMTDYDANATPTSWIDPVYVTLPRDQIATMEIKNDSGDFILNRAPEEEWTLDGLSDDELFDPSKANQLLGQIANLRMLEPLGTENKNEYGLNNPLAELIVTVEAEEGVSQSNTLRIGAFDEENSSYVVKWSDSAFYVSVPAFMGDTLIELNRDSFIQSPPAEETGG